ncbi:MAG: hypothetical protein M1839_001542 [Geoglossum umbratile]|nr:MAG: hypothetical protein M1839_001542 [Geoglossum umbratile]
MLRRKPTAISLTSEDVSAYAESLRRKRTKQNDSGDSTTSAASTLDPNDELRPLPGEKARIVRTREERIGVGQRGIEQTAIDTG